MSTTTSLQRLIVSDPKKGLLLTSSVLGSLILDDGSISLHELAKTLTGCVPKDERLLGIRDALLEILSSHQGRAL